jgi:hypothetical protein
VPKPKKRPTVETPPPEKPGPPVQEPEKALFGLTPWSVFQAAMKAVPALKYALAVLGLVSAVALIKGFGIGYDVAVFGTIIMMVLMVALVVFASLTKVKTPQIRIASHILMWSFLVLTILTAVLLFTSAFFDYPKPLPTLLRGGNSGAAPVNPQPEEFEFSMELRPTEKWTFAGLANRVAAHDGGCSVEFTHCDDTLKKAEIWPNHPVIVTAPSHKVFLENLRLHFRDPSIQRYEVEYHKERKVYEIIGK